MTHSDMVYKFQWAGGHKAADKDEWLTAISVAARDVCDQGGQDQRECYCLCYLGADGPVEPYHRCFGD